MADARSKIIQSIEQLEALYGLPLKTATIKEIGRIIPEYRAYIEASPFVVMATSGPDGLDCSPRGDVAGFVCVADDQTSSCPTGAATTVWIPCAILFAIRE